MVERRDPIDEDRIAADPAAEEVPKAHAGARLEPHRASSAWGRLLETVRNPSLPALAGFATVIALVVVLMQQSPLPPDTLVALPADPERLALRSVPGDRLPGAIGEAIVAYGENDLERAVELLEATDADDVADAVRRVYLGSALARLGRPEEALVALEPVADLPLPEPWGSEARWTRVISLRETGRAEEAAIGLAALAASQGPVADRARRLIASDAE